MSDDVKMWRYVLRSESRNGWNEGWAIFLLDSKGFFAVCSDYGDYVYHWGSIGPTDFRVFLCGLDRSYLIGKIAPKKEYDAEATKDFVKETIISHRRDGTFTKEEAREEWDLMQECDFDDFNDWLRQTQISDAWEMAIYRHSRQALAFYDRVWPRFIALLKEDLASEPGV